MGASHPDKLKGIVALSTPFEFAFFLNYPHGILNMKKIHLAYALRFASQSYNHFKTPPLFPWWLKTLRKEAKIIFEWLQSDLNKINVPVMLVHSLYDLIVPYNEMEKIAECISHLNNVTKVTLTYCGHQILSSNSKAEKQAISIILNFIESL